jgi:hypothetical protein
MLDLNIDLTDVSTTMPVLSSGLYNMVISDMEVQENKKKTGNNLVVTFKTTTAETSVQAMEKGEADDLKPGYPVKKWYPLQQSDNENAPDFRRDLAALQEAAVGSKGLFDMDQIRGKAVAVKIGVSDSEQYGLSNDVNRVTAPIV